MENNNDKKISDVLEIALSKIKEIASSDTIIGEPIILTHGTVIPVCKVSLGYALGGGEMKTYQKKDPLNFPVSVATGGGASIIPIGFLIDSPAGIQFVNAQSATSGFEQIISSMNKIYTFINKKRDDHAKN